MFGLSKSKSSSSADTTNDSSHRVSDQSQMTGLGVSNITTGGKSKIDIADKSNNQGLMLEGVNRSNITISETDHGAVTGAFDFARDIGGEAFGFGQSALLAVDAAGQSAMQALDAAGKRSTQQADSALSAIAGLTETLKTGTSQKTILWLVGGTLVAVTVVVVAFTVGDKS